MRIVSSVVITVALSCGGCSTNAPEVEFCQVINARSSFLDKEFRTEIVAIPDYHGVMAADLRCHGRGIKFADSTFEATPELRELSKKIDTAYDLHNPLKPPPPGPVMGVVVRVTARIEKSPSAPSEFVLRLLGAEESRIVDVPQEFFELPKGIAPEERASH